MNPRDVQTVQDAKTIVDERGLSHVKIGLFDNDGIMRGKYMSRKKFFAALDHGFSFCDVILGWDCRDQLYDNARYTGWHTGYPDAPVRVLPGSCRDIPLEDNMLLFLGEFAGPAEAVCPRATLRRLIDRAAALGFDVFASLEYEFFLFEETPDSIREKQYRDLQPMTPGWFGYSMIRNSTHAALHRQILELGEIMDFPIEGIHTETGPGVLETAITVDTVLNAADKGALFKTFMKVLAQQNGLMATFMAKWSDDYPGQSGHIHMSLRHKEGSGRCGSAFYDPDQKDGVSIIQRQFVAGQQRLMPEVLCMIAPTVNSYSRMVPGFWAPTDASFGRDNRTTALRVIPGSESSQRVEHRLGAADANPYLALAAALGSGLIGIEQQWEPENEIVGNAYEQSLPAHLALPRTLWDAAQALKNSATARDLFGDAFVDHFAASREWEERQFRQHVTDWELRRYFEII